MIQSQTTNQEIASLFERIAALLEAQDANPHRVRAYRNAANRARNLDRSLAELVMSGDGAALQALPDIGEGLARVITHYVHSGRSQILDRLQGQVSPEQVFQQVPGIGPNLARRITKQLDISTLPELEQAAHDGHLQEVNGFGPRRVEQVRTSLAGMLSRSALGRAHLRTQNRADDQDQPQVATLLAVDAEYVRKVNEDSLRKIAPRRFNPENRTWLPILHTSRQGWDFTVLYSNTARAHELQKTHDWVVIYYERDSHEDQVTAVTATQGMLKGKRVIRGREAECERYYQIDG